MLRVGLLAVAFLVVSPALRKQVFHVYEIFAQEVTLHSTIAMVATGFLVFVSFLGIQLTAKK